MITKMIKRIRVIYYYIVSLSPSNFIFALTNSPKDSYRTKLQTIEFIYIAILLFFRGCIHDIVELNMNSDTKKTA